MENVVVSVLICTYNQERFIVSAIESVLAQQCEARFEILIGDDCSTDNTGKIADEYQHRYPEVVRVIRPERNMGMAQNLVRLISAAKGEFLAICDGDDYWLREDVLQKHIDVFRSMPDVGMVCAVARCFKQDKGKLEGTLGDVGAENLMTMIRNNSDVAAPTLAFRTELMRKCMSELKWNIELDHFYDTVMAYWFASYSRIKFINEELAVYRVLPNSACHASTLEVQHKYQKRYFAIKWHYVLTHPELYGEEIYDVLMSDFDQQVAYSAYLSEVKVRNSITHKIGNFILSPIKWLKHTFVKAKP